MNRKTKIILLSLIILAALVVIFCLVYKKKEPINTIIDPQNPFKNVDPERRGAPGYVPTLEESGQLQVLNADILLENIQTGTPAKIEVQEGVVKKELTDAERKAAPQYLQ